MGKKPNEAPPITVEVEVMPLPPRAMMHLHNEYGHAEIEGHQVRFCQHVNGACFWLAVDQDLYLVKTEDLMNAVLNAVMPRYLPEEPEESDLQNPPAATGGHGMGPQTRKLAR